MWLQLLVISLGASCGACLRWVFGLGLNHWLPQLPLGTLAANLVGGYLAGLALAFFLYYPQLPLEWRLLIITGFLGGLTTFSSFSVEVFSLLQRGQLAWALGAIGLHVLGSLAMTGLGVLTFQWLRG